MLTSRQVGHPAIGVLECPKCAGLWLAKDELQILLQKVRATAASTEPEIDLALPSYRSAERVTQDGPLYRTCPVCRKLMHRRNFGRKSGIIVDQCTPHGYWFDNQELEAVLRWVSRGGEQQVARLREEDQRQAGLRQQMDRQSEPATGGGSASRGGSGPLVDLLGWLASHIR